VFRGNQAGIVVGDGISRFHIRYQGLGIKD
jgi:hypothetical protein